MNVEKLKKNPYPKILEINLSPRSEFQKVLPGIAWKQRNTIHNADYQLSLLWKLRLVKKIIVSGIISVEQWRVLTEIIRLLPIMVLDCGKAEIDAQFVKANSAHEYLPRFGFNPEHRNFEVENCLPRIPDKNSMENYPSEFLRQSRCNGEITSVRYNSNTLNELVLPQGIRLLPTEYCAYLPLKKLTLPQSLQTFSCRAIYDTPIEILRIPGSCKKISKEACYRNLKLRKLILDEGIETIETSAFRFCSNLSEIKWPSTLYYLADYAFFNNPHFNRSSFPRGVQLDYNVFGMPGK